MATALLATGALAAAPVAGATTPLQFTNSTCSFDGMTGGGILYDCNFSWTGGNGATTATHTISSTATNVTVSQSSTSIDIEFFCRAHNTITVAVQVVDSLGAAISSQVPVHA